LIFFLQEGIIHPEDFPQFHPIDQDTYYTYTITLNNVFAQYVNFYDNWNNYYIKTYENFNEEVLKAQGIAEFDSETLRVSKHSPISFFYGQKSSEDKITK